MQASPAWGMCAAKTSGPGLHCFLQPVHQKYLSKISRTPDKADGRSSNAEVYPAGDSHRLGFYNERVVILDSFDMACQEIVGQQLHANLYGHFVVRTLSAKERLSVHCHIRFTCTP